MEVRSSVPIRKFVMVHEDFLEADFLSVEEKMVYIVLKSFMAYGQDADEVYPSMETICRLSSMSRNCAFRTAFLEYSLSFLRSLRNTMTHGRRSVITHIER